MSKNAIGKKGFHHLAVKVRDYEKSLEFYIKGLGLEVKYQWGEVGKRAANAKITDEPFDFDIQSDPIYPVRIAFCKGPDQEIIEFFQER